MTEARIAIVTDSTAYLPPELLEQYNIHMAPQTLILGEKTYYDGVDISANAFYELLKTSKIAATTSQITVNEFKEAFEKAGAGKDGIVVIVVSHDLSGTYNSAVQAKAMLPDMNIELIDSRVIAMALGFVVLAAARAAAKGQSIEEVVAVANATIPNVGIMFTVETLEYLRRGGRIGGAQALLGNVLNLKPVLNLDDGKVEPLQRIRTKKKAMRFILNELEARLKGKSNIQLATINALADQEAHALLEEANKRVGAIETFATEASPVVCAHTGPGTVGIAWCHTVAG